MKIKDILKESKVIENLVDNSDISSEDKYNSYVYLNFCKQLIKDKIDSWKLSKGNIYYVKEIDDSSQISVDDLTEYYQEVVILDISVSFEDEDFKPGNVLVKYAPTNTKWASSTTVLFNNAFKQLYVKVNNNYYTLAELFEIKTED